MLYSQQLLNCILTRETLHQMDGLLEVAITSHYYTLMKTRLQKQSKKNLQLKLSEMKDALEWIDNLTPKEKSKLQQLATVQFAQVLIDAYFKSKAGRSRQFRLRKSKHDK